VALSTKAANKLQFLPLEEVPVYRRVGDLRYQEIELRKMKEMIHLFSEYDKRRQFEISDPKPKKPLRHRIVDQA